MIYFTKKERWPSLVEGARLEIACRGKSPYRGFKSRPLRSFLSIPINDMKINIACCGIIVNGEEVLITKRSVPPFLGKYVLPGGKLDFGESLDKCLKREIFEETGLIIRSMEFFDFYELFLEDKYYLIMYFICESDSYNLKINREEISEVRWIGKEEIENFDIAPGSKKILKRFFHDRNNREI